jgi:hypothetical protein
VEKRIMPSSKPILSNVGLAVTAATFTRQQVELTGGDVTTSSATFVDATGLTLTVARTVTGGIIFAHASLSYNNGLTTVNMAFRWVDGASNKIAILLVGDASGIRSCSLPLSGALSSQVIKIQFHSNGVNAMTIYGGTTTDADSMIQLAEIG